MGKCAGSDCCRRLKSLDVEPFVARLTADEQIAGRIFLRRAGDRDRDRKM
jgi:hypothetical protein